MHSSKYTLVFTFCMCVFISVLLAGTSAVLKDRQLLNKKIDVQKNILVAAGINIVHVNQVEKLYDKLVTPLLISSSGKIIKDNQNSNDQTFLKIFCIGHKDRPEKVASYVYPIKGKGLWSSLYGYLSVNPKGDTIIGITFYKHGETPGLGAEIEKKWFRDNFAGKKLYEKDKLVGIIVAKGKAKYNINYKEKSQSMVDGISGATITSKGVEKMLYEEPLKYHIFFNK